MSDSYKNMLRKVLVALPEQERLVFLREVIASLQPYERQKLLANISSSLPPATRPPEVGAADVGMVMPPKRTAPTAAVVSRPVAPIAPVLRKPPAAAGLPKAPAPSSAPIAEPELAAGQKNPPQRDDDYFKMLAASGTASTTKIRGQLIGLLAMAVGALILLAGLAVGMAKVWEWIKSLL